MLFQQDHLKTSVFGKCSMTDTNKSHIQFLLQYHIQHLPLVFQCFHDNVKTKIAVFNITKAQTITISR